MNKPSEGMSIGEAVEACVALGMDRQVAANQMANAIAALANPPTSALRNKLTELFDLGFQCGKDFDRFNTDSLEQKRDRIIAELVAEFGKEKPPA